MATQKGASVLKAVTEFISKSSGFEKLLQKVTLVTGGNGTCTAEFKVSEEHLNGGGGLHGGYIATLVDCISTYALMTNEQGNSSPGVSVNMQINYLKGARKGDDIVVDAKTLRAGKNLAFLEVELKKKSTNEIIATGSHIKFIGQ